VRRFLGQEIVVTPGARTGGFDFESINVTVYSEWDLFRAADMNSIDASRFEAPLSRYVVTDLRDPKVGDFIVRRPRRRSLPRHSGLPSATA